MKDLNDLRQYLPEEQIKDLEDRIEYKEKMKAIEAKVAAAEKTIMLPEEEFKMLADKLRNTKFSGFVTKEDTERGLFLYPIEFKYITCGK